jgi:hypothetical protein
MADSDLKPEHVKAFRRLHSFLTETPNRSSNLQSSASAASLVEGSVEVYSNNITARRIPSGLEWRWNQAKGKKEIFLRDHSANAVLTKLIPRRRHLNATEVPRYKLWHFAVYPKNEEPFTVLWCEKGSPPPPSPPSSPLPLAPPGSQLMKAQLSYICN